jgi:serine/threonine protein kinase
MTDSRDEMDVESDDQFSANLTAPLRRSPPSTGTAIQVGDSQPTPPRKIHKDQPSIPGYEFLKRLGRGGMGVVWLCRDLRAGRVVALKQTTCDDWRDADHARFRTEAQAMARLDHPQIVKVFEVNEFEGIPYFTMEYCPGGSLQEFLDRKPQPPALAGVMVEKLARGVQHAHQNGIVHRDLKPANVLLASDFGTRGSDSKAPEPTAEGTTDAERRREAFHISVRNPHSAVLKITDFGLAKNLDTDQHLTRTEAVMGTPSYMAPEQARSAKTAGPPADVWSLGVILYEAITGSLPFVGADFVEIVENVRLQDPVRPSERVKCPRDLETICLKCLEKNPQRRYAHAGDLAEDLQAWLDGKPISARPVGPLERALRWAGRHRTLAMLYAVSLIALVALLGLGFWFSNRIGAEQAKRESDLKQADLERKNLEAKASLEREAEREKTFAAQKLARTQEYFTRLSQVRERNSSRRPGWTWANLEDLKSAAKIPMQSDPEQLRTLAAETLSAIDVRLLKSVGKGINGMSIAWHPDGKRIAVGERASGLALFCKVTLIDLETDKAQELFFQPVAITKKGKPVPDRVNDLAFSPDGRWLVAGMRSGPVSLGFDAGDARPTKLVGTRRGSRQSSLQSRWPRGLLAQYQTASQVVSGRGTEARRISGSRSSA